MDDLTGWLRAQTWPTTPEGWVGLVAGVVVIATGIITGVGWFVPATRPRVVALVRFVRSLPSRLPVRIVKTRTLVALRASQHAVNQNPSVAQAPPRLKPLTPRERVEKAAAFCEDELGRYDAMSPRQRPHGYFRSAARAVNEVVDDSKDWRIAMDYRLSGGVRGYDDPTRADIEYAMKALRSIDWQKPPPGVVTVERY